MSSQREVLAGLLTQAQTDPRHCVALVCKTRKKADQLRWALYRVRDRHELKDRFRLSIRLEGQRAAVLVEFLPDPMAGVEIQ